MLSITPELFPHGTAEHGLLDEIFDRLELNQDGPVTYLILAEIDRLLEHGKSIGFVPKHDHMGNSAIPDSWEIWSSTLDKSVARYESITPPDICSRFVHSPHESTGSRPVDLLLHPDPADLSEGRSSNIQGLKLIFLALLTLPRSKTARLNIKNTAIHFRRGIGLVELFPRLPLNFEADTSLSSLIDLSGRLIKERYQKHDSFRKFLTALRNSLVVLDGYELGTTTSRTLRDQLPSTPPRHHKTKTKAKIIQLTPFHNPTKSNEEPYIGDLTEVTTEEGEEPLIGLIEATSDDPDKDEIPETASSANSQFKSKFWIQAYNNALPWNSRGINPFTRRILVDWIKSNDTLVSLTLGLMLCTGRKTEGILEFRLGESADFTINGEYTRHYMPPDNSFTPSVEQQSLLETLDPVIQLPLPDIIKARFCGRCKISDYGKTLAETWGINVESVKQDTQDTVKKLIRIGANGLSIDRIPLSLHKRVAEITGDDALGYILASRNNDMPPVSTYYSSFTHAHIEAVYRQAVWDLYQ